MHNFLRVVLLSSICQGVIDAKFEIELNRKITENGNTTDVYQHTLVGCAWLCFHDKKCRATSFNMDTSTCRLDFTDQCCVATEKSDTWNLIRNYVYRKFFSIFLINRKCHGDILYISNATSAMQERFHNNYIYLNKNIGTSSLIQCLN